MRWQVRRHKRQAGRQAHGRQTGVHAGVRVQLLMICGLYLENGNPDQNRDLAVLQVTDSLDLRRGYFIPLRSKV